MVEAQEFNKTASVLARNPLGIIALFITLVHSFATLLLGVSADKLRESERLPLIWFVVLFPVLVLAAFYRLVTNHYVKLYSPGDFDSDASFLKALSALEKSRIRTAKVASVLYSPADLKRKSLGPESRSLSRETESMSPPNKQQIESKYILAEKYVFHKLEKELGSTFVRQVSFGEGLATAFDGVAQDGDTFTAVEVNLLAYSSVWQPDISDFIYRGQLASAIIKGKSSKKRLRLMLALVLESTESGAVESLERSVTALIQLAPIRVGFRIFMFDELKREFEADSV